ncbi:MAG: CHASE2 domain-containing protein [Sterolibacteriaceae bacterium]|uniref:histidine kinase n=1 Tax=Candidatus Methylophosphatis roskildensis TaxID=2899263 RepID=A0A9D7E7H7_9PROT|nr:CHASE2 domain-containing protein [Candidatus Methylophosphatis roskildensis]
MTAHLSVTANADPARIETAGTADRRAIFEWWLLSLLIALLAAACAWQQWLWRADQAIYDTLLTLAERAPRQDIVIVGIDDDSLSQIGRWPWRLAIHATLIDRLTEAGARGVLLDLIFSEPEGGESRGDAALESAIRRNGRTVLAVALESTVNRRLTEAAPTPALSAAAAAVGHIDAELDPDGVARSVYLWAGLGAPRYPQLALALLQTVDPAAAAPYGRQWLGPANPADARAWLRDRWLRIPFAGPPGSFRQVSYVDVLAGRVRREELAGKYVLVGATAIGLGDAYPTPVSGFGRTMPGVEFHANVLESLIEGRAIVTIERSRIALVAAVLATGLMLVLLRSSARRGLLASAALLVLALVVPAWLLIRGGTWFAPSPVLLTALIAYPLWSWRRLESIQRFIDAELRQMQREPNVLGLTAPLPDRHSADSFANRIELVRAAAERQRTARHFVEETLNGLPVGVMVADARQHVVLTNQRLRVLLALDDTALRGQTLAAMLSSLQARTPIDFAARLAELGEVGALLQFECETSRGMQLFVSVIGLIHVDGLAGIIASFADTSELHAAQKARDETMRFISHDLRSPLASIVTLIDHTARSAHSTSADNLALIGRYAHGALDLADDLFRLARAEAADPRRFVNLDPAALLQDAADEAWAAAEKKAIHVELSTECAWDTAVLGDAGLLRRAITNLLDNAIKYSPPKTTVSISLREAGELLLIRVSDEGYGIAPEHVGQLFTRYARFATPGQPEEGGVGLGLVMVKTVLERHGGSVDVNSEVGKGTRFTLRLPRSTLSG